MHAESPEKLVGVHVGNGLLALRPEFAPPGNYVAYGLLRRVLELALLGAGLTREDSCRACGGELNDCIFGAPVTDAIKAVETIKRELAAQSLLSHSQIGIWEASGWRCVYPSSGVRMQWLMDTERLEHASAQSLHLLDKRMAFFAEVWRQLASPELQKGQKK
jgi:hypothetical protein